MLNPLHSSTWKTALFLGILLAGVRIAPAQALPVAYRSPEITPFAQTTLVSPDWGPTHNLGYTIGLDYTRYIRSIVQPSLELRMTSATNGTVVGERSYLGGLKLQIPFHRIHPYGTLLAGYGGITFTHPTGYYYGDNSFVYALGAGVDFNLTSQLVIQADFSHQQWNIDPQSLTPVTMGVGIAYHLPIHSGRVQ